MTDTERLNKLQEIVGRYTGKVICRISTSGRGLRLHETSRHGAVESIREAIDNFLMEQEDGWNEIEQTFITISTKIKNEKLRTHRQ